jgi:hypothetical protein
MADTLRVDVCYRPLRIGWAVREGDMAAVRQAVKASHALWGGRFNPILVVDREEEARQLVELFRLDLIWPFGDSHEVKHSSRISSRRFTAIRSSSNKLSGEASPTSSTSPTRLRTGTPSQSGSSAMIRACAHTNGSRATHSQTCSSCNLVPTLPSTKSA